MKEFIFIVSVASIVSGFLLLILKNIEVFSYSLTMRSFIASDVFVFSIPLQAIVYIPVFIFTVYTFYKYWELAMYDKNLFSKYTLSLKKDVLITSGMIFFIGYLMHPLLDMTISSIAILIIGEILGLILTSLVIGFLNTTPLFQRYISGVFIFSVLVMFMVSSMSEYHMITFSQSILSTYTSNTIQVPGFAFSDVEFVGIILFSCLIIAMAKYFKVITDNTSLKFEEEKMTFKGWDIL